MMYAHNQRNASFDAGKSGFGYPVPVNSNNSFVEDEADLRGLKTVVKDLTGNQLDEYVII